MTDSPDSSRPLRVLVVDDEPAMREVLSARLGRWGYDVQTAETVASARVRAERFRPDVIVSDLVLPDATGLDLLVQLRAEDPRRTVLLITAYGTIDTAVRAMKAGACHFLTKPIDYGVLKEHLDASPRLDAEGPSAVEPVARAEEALEQSPAFGGMVGQSPALLRMQERLRAAAASDAPVLIVGESGTGKELVARTVVACSKRAGKPFVTVNAAAIPEALVESELFGVERGAFTGADRAREGLFEQANGGSLFLDEVTEMPLSLQPKLLRVLEDGRIRKLGGRTEVPCDVRVVAATNRNPTAAVEAGLLRHDLVYRLDVLRIDVPPLRERKGDLPILARHFLADCGRRYEVATPELTAEAVLALEAYDWPGNIRQLRNVMERGFLLAQAERGPLRAAHLGLDAVVGVDSAQPLGAGGEPHGIVIPAGQTLAEAERILILETLKRTGNNKAEAARRLGLDVKTIRNKLKVFEDGTAA